MSASNPPVRAGHVRHVSQPTLAIELQSPGNAHRLDRGTVQDELDATIVAAPPNHQHMGDDYGPPPGHPVESDWGPLCSVMLKTMGRDCAFQLIGGGIGTLAMSALPIAAMPYAAPVCVVCAGGLSLYGCYMAGRGILGRGGETEGWRESLCTRRSALACAVGATGGAACSGMAAAGLAASWVHTAELTAAAVQLGVRCIRYGVRDSLTQLSAGCTGTIRAVDLAGVDRGLQDARMARMEAKRLWGSCLCYTAIQLVSVFAVQPAIADCMDAPSLGAVIRHGGGFDDKAMALAPGLLAGAGAEGLDGFFGQLIATLAALQSGNRVVAERGRDMLKVVMENMGTVAKLKETAGKSLQNAAMRMFVNNLSADLSVLMSMQFDDDAVAGLIVGEATRDKGVVAIGITELRGKLVAMHRDLPRTQPDAAVHFDPVLAAFVGAPAAEAVGGPQAEHMESKAAPPDGGFAARIDSAQEEITANLKPGATFNLHGVPCKVKSVVPGQNKIEIGAERPLGGVWIGSDDKKSPDGDYFTPGEYRYTYKGSRSVVAKQLVAEHVLPNAINPITDRMVLAAGLERAGSVRVVRADGKHDEVPVIRDGKQLRIGAEGSVVHVSGSPVEVAAQLLQRGVTFRNVVLEHPEEEFEVVRSAIHTRDHLERVLARPGNKFVVTVPGLGPSDARSVICEVAEGGVKVTDKHLPNFVPGGEIAYFPEDGMYRASRGGNMAHWLWSQRFELQEIVTASARQDPSAVDRKLQPLPPSLLRRLPAVPVDRAMRAGDRMVIGGHYCHVGAVRSHDLVLRSDTEIPVLNELAENRSRKADGWHYVLTLVNLGKARPFLVGKKGIVIGSEQFAVTESKQTGATILVGSGGEPNPMLIRLFGAPMPAEVEGGYSYEISPDQMAAGLDALRELLPNRDVPAPSRVNGIDDLVAGARKVIDELREVFGAADSKAGGHNRDVLTALTRFLDGRSRFVQGGIRPDGGVRQLLDLSEFEVDGYNGRFEQVDMALAAGPLQAGSAGEGVATMRSEASRREHLRAEALSHHLHPALVKIVDSYVAIADSVLQDMADAAALLAAGSSPGSGARKAAGLVKTFARTQGRKGDGLAAALEPLRARASDPMRAQAFAFLERTIHELGVNPP